MFAGNIQHSLIQLIFFQNVIPANTGRPSKIGSMLGPRRRQRANIKPALGKCFFKWNKIPSSAVYLKSLACLT